MPKNPHADFSPVLDGYSGIGAFRFWCQTALPLTYDDSLSYYELLNKVVNYLNHTIEDLTAVESNTSALANAYDQLQKYVNDYFDDLDVEAELRNVLDAMAEDGTLDALLNPLVENQLPGVVDEKIDAVVAEQIGGAVAGQIDESVADQLPALVDAGIPGEVTDWLSDNVNPVGSAVVVDSSLTISGAAADAKVTGDKLSNLKTQLHHLGNSKNLLWISPLTENKYYYTSATASPTYSYFAINVENGKTYKSATHIRFISRPGAIISDADTYTYTATADETLYFTLYNESRSSWAICESTVDINTVGTYDAPTLNDTTLAQTTGQSKSKVMSQKAVVDAVGIVNTNANKVSADNDIIETMAVPSPNLYQIALNGYLLNYETGNPIASASFETSDFIPVKPGDEIHYQFDYTGIRRDSINYSGYSTMYIVCAYRYDKSYIPDSYATNATSYTVPADAEYIRVSLSISTTFTNRALIKSTTTDIIPYFEPDEVAYINPKYLTPKDEYKHFSGAYSGEIKFTDLETSAKAMLLNAVIDFDALPTFELGIKNTSNTLFKVSVDSTKLYVYDYVFGGTSSVTREYTHGLTLGKDLAVAAVFNNRGVKVSICSDGEKYEMSDFLQITRAGLGYPYFVISNGTADYVSVSVSTKDINRYIWLFGDSYFSDSSDRWVYYLNQSGVDTYMIDAYPGEDSAKSLKSLQNLLKIGHPSYIVWCLGMNDGSDSDAPRSTWKNAFDEVKRLCGIYGIEMIAATIPTVPSINNEYKNAYVKASGLKYIDFSKAVGASSGGVWYDGMLDTDNVHPTAKGAKALYYTAITDFQQLQIKNH